MRFLNRWMSRSREHCGQALVEFMFVGIILLLMLFGMIDFCRALSTKQVLINLAREGANQASRGAGTTIDGAISNAINAVIAGSSPLNINTKGRVIISAILNSNGVAYKVTNQISEGGLAVTSRIAPGGVGSSPTGMPFAVNSVGAIPQRGKTMYVSEVYYSFTNATPIGALMNFKLPSPLYESAYF